MLLSTAKYLGAVEKLKPRVACEVVETIVSHWSIKQVVSMEIEGSKLV